MSFHWHADTSIENRIQEDEHRCFTGDSGALVLARRYMDQRIAHERAHWYHNAPNDAAAAEMEEAHESAISEIYAYEGREEAIEATITGPDGLEYAYRIMAIDGACTATI